MKVSPKVAVTAYFDGKAHAIQNQVLGGLDRFEKARQQSPQDLVVRVDGQRSPRALQFATAGAFALTGLAVVGGAVALGLAGAALAPVAGLGALGVYIASLGEDSLRQGLKMPQWSGREPVQLGHGSIPSEVPARQPGQQLQQLLQSNLRDFPSARQVVCLAGHGDHQQVGPLTYQAAAEALQGNKVDHLLLDTCLGGQLEVLSRLAPWSRFVIASSQPIPAIGLPLDKMFQPELLLQENGAQAQTWVEQARAITPSLAAWDSDKFCQEFLPALGQLGQQLEQEIHRGNRDSIKRALARSSSPERFWTSKVDMGSFLRQLQGAELSPSARESVQKALQAFEASLVHSQNQRTLTFHLQRERQDLSLPEGWRGFLEVADFSRKPGFLF